jgi:cytidine deaminase
MCAVHRAKKQNDLRQTQMAVEKNLSNHRQQPFTDEPKIGQELFIGLVAAVGTELDQLQSYLKADLETLGFDIKLIHLAALLRQIPKYKDLPDTPRDKYVEKFMEAGTEFRATIGRGDALAILGLTKVRAFREEAKRNAKAKKATQTRPCAYILRSLKNPAEAHTLREIYGDAFVLIAAYSSHDARLRHFANRIAKSNNEFPIERHLGRAEDLMQTDQEELGTKLGQGVRKTFHLADVFVDTNDPGELRNSLTRFIELLFGNAFHTPTRDEYGMYQATAAAMRSSELGRQVGAAISTVEGDVVALGTNEVPKAGGGLYWCTDKPDKRQFLLGFDSNDEQIGEVIADVLKRLQGAGWLAKSKNLLDVKELVKLALEGDKPPLKGSRATSLIEFGRAVHAEMAAITDAARRGVSVNGCAMYVTAFPCHLCARHVVASGIGRLVYIEPYPKSLSGELFPDSISIDAGHAAPGHVPFNPFVGIAPRKYVPLFSMKGDDDRKIHGKVREFDRANAILKYSGLPPRAYLDSEQEKITLVRLQMAKHQLM